MSDAALTPAWVDATNGYQLALVDGALTCRNAKKTVLKSVPKAVKDTECATELLAVRDFLVRHEAECRARVEGWMVGSHAVPAQLLASVWPDEAWSQALTNLVVIAGPERGLLRAVDESGRIGIVDLDGETRWLTATQVQIPHPIDIPDLADFQELAAEIGATQRIAQLARQVYPKPDSFAADAQAVADFKDARFEQLRHATSRAANAGFQVRGGFAICPVLDAGRRLQARYWIGSDAPDLETWTGELIWVDGDEKPVPLASLGALAYSEGVRMAATIYAGRVVKDEE